MNALQNADILHLIFLNLSQLDLLRVQSVCRTWHFTIENSTDLLSLVWLPPGECHTEPHPSTKPILNPLLEESFPSFFHGTSKSKFTTASSWGTAGPWIDLARNLAVPPYEDLVEDRRRQEKFMRPEASWRKMMPCWPPPKVLHVNFFRGYEGRTNKLARLEFSNNEDHQQNLSKGRPAWLTFGLVYDLVENAWFQGRPDYVSCVKFHFLDKKNSAGRPRNNTNTSVAQRSALPDGGRV